MSNKKVIDLVNFAEKALSERWGYVWGGSGEIFTLEVAEKLYKAYATTKYDKIYYLTTQMNLWKNRRVCDCSGLLRAFGASGTANSIYQACKEKGSLKNWTAIEGGLVFCQGNDGSMNHIGIVVSNGHVIHSTNSQKGVIKEKLATSTRGWTHYGRASFIDYGVMPSNPYNSYKKV